MADRSIEHLRDEVSRRYGARVHSYGSEPDETHGYGFRIEGISALFSAITLEGTLADDCVDVQVESDHPGDYLFAKQVSLVEFIKLMERFALPTSEWPSDR